MVVAHQHITQCLSCWEIFKKGIYHQQALPVNPLICGIPEDDQEKKSYIFNFLVHFWAHCATMNSSHKQKRKMCTRKFVFFAQQFSTFMHLMSCHQHVINLSCWCLNKYDKNSYFQPSIKLKQLSLYYYNPWIPKRQDLFTYSTFVLSQSQIDLIGVILALSQMAAKSCTNDTTHDIRKNNGGCKTK